MPEDTKQPTAKPEKAPAPKKTARVEVIKDGVRIGNFTFAKGRIIESMDLDEMKIRTDAGEIRLVNVN